MVTISTSRKLNLSLLLDQICFALMMVTFGPHVLSLGGSQLYLGVIMSGMSLVGLIWNPIAGSLSDTYGRKFILVRLLILSAISHGLLVISSSLVVIFISRIIGAFVGPVIAVLGTTASEVLTKEDQPSYYNRIPTIMSMCFLIGPIFGGFLTELDNGVYICYMLMVGLNLINIRLATTLPEAKKKEKATKESLPVLQVTKREIKNVASKLTNVNWKEYSDIFSVKLCFELGCSLFYNSLGRSFVHFGVKGRSIGFLFTLVSLCRIAANMVLIRLQKTMYAQDKYGSMRLFHAAIMLVTTAVIFSFSNSIVPFSSGLMTMSIARTICDSTFTQALMAKASDKDKGGVSGAFESITSFCGLITPIGAGILTDWYGPQIVFKLSIAPTLIGLLLTYSQNESQKKRQ